MRPQMTPFVVVAIDDGKDSQPETDEYRQRLFQCQAERYGLGFKKVKGFWEGKEETTYILSTPDPINVSAAHTLGQMWDQKYICVVHSDGSAYELDVATGTTKYKGYWKKVQDWQVSRLLADGGPFTYDPSTNTYYVVGS